MNWLFLIPIALAGFLQNLTKVWAVRSQTSADIRWHRMAAYSVNSAWFWSYVVVFRQIWAALTEQDWWLLFATFVVYTISTSEGSVIAMSWLLAREHGKQRVGAKLRR